MAARLHRPQVVGVVDMKDVRRFCFAVAPLAIGVFGVLSPAWTAWSGTAVEVFRKVAPSIVVVLALDHDGGAKAQGSGVVVSEKEVVTNCHVLRGAAAVAVRQASGSGDGRTWRMKAALLVVHERRDLCLLHIAELSEPPAASVARLGSARGLSTGEEVFAVGAPAGLELSLSRGIVSQLRGIMGKWRAPLVQTDAAISPGSSGGGLFNDNGELVGITTFKWRGESLNFALPVEWVRELLKEASGVKTRSACLVKPGFECVTDLARETAYGTEDPYSRAWALAHIASAEVSAGEGQLARETLDAAFGTARNIEDADLRGELLHRIARTQAEVGDIATALKTASEIPNSFPNLYNRLLYHTGTRAGALTDIVLVQAREGAVQAALTTARGIQDPWNRAFVLGELASFAKTDIRTQQATRRAFAAVLETALDIADGRIRKFRLQRVVRAIYDWREESFFGNWDPDLMSNIAVLHAWIGDMPAALRTVQDIEQDWQLHHALTWIAILQVRSGDFSSALNIEKQFQKQFNSRSLYRKIAFERAKAGDITGALKMAKLLEKENEENDSVYYAIAVEQAAAGDINGGLLTAGSVDLAAARASALAEIAVVQAKAGQDDAARRTSTAAFQTLQARGLTSFPIFPSVFHDIAINQTKAGDIVGALVTVENIDEPYLRASALAEIAGAQAETGQEEAAQRTLAAASKVAQGLDASKVLGLASFIGQIAVAQAEVGDWRGARQTLAAALEARRSDRDSYFLKEFVKLQAKAGDIAAALKMASAINNELERVRALIDIGGQQVNAGARRAARWAFDAALKAALRVDSDDSRKYYVSRIADGLATAGYFARALKTAQGNVRALGSIAVVQAEAGRFKDAVNTAINIDRVDVRAESLAEIAVRRKRRDWEASLGMTLSDRVLVQRVLLELGKDVGPADGVFGRRTRTALRSWQVDEGVEATGYLTRKQWDELKATGKSVAP